MADPPVENEDESNSWWWLGALIYISGSILINLGSNLIRSSHERFRKKEEAIPLYKRYLWMAACCVHPLPLFASWGTDRELGWALFGVGNVMNFVAFMFAAQSLLVGLGSVQFVTNLIFARLVNKETITPLAVVATCVIIIGNVIIVIFGSKESQVFDVSDLWDLLIRPSFLVYIGGCIAAIIVFQAIYLGCLYYKYKRKEQTIPPFQNHLLSRFVPFSYAIVSAIIGTFSVTIGKALSGIVLAAVDPNMDGELLSIWPWLILLLFIGFTVFWLYRMNTALRRYDALFIIPVLQGMWLLFGTLCGGIYYEEFLQMSGVQQIMFGAGVIVLLLGVAMMSPKAVTEDPVNEGEDDSAFVKATYERFGSDGESAYL